SLLGRSTMRPAPVLPCSSSPPTPSCQGQKTGATQDQARNASTDDGAGHRVEYRDAARIRKTRRAGVQRGGAGDRHENIAFERFYRDRMRIDGRGQIDGLQNVAGFVDYVEEPTGVGVIITGDVELFCRRVVPDLVRTTQNPGSYELDEVAVFIEQDRL